jgi:NTE family protein
MTKTRIAIACQGGGAGVLSGKLKKFVSRKDVIGVEHLLASCAVPHIFPAVQIGDDAYWDGLFADNPPIGALMRPMYVGEGNIPEEIWLIKIDCTTRHTVPTMPDDITDRRKQMEGNVALLNQLKAMEVVNDMHLWGGYTPELKEYLQWDKPVRLPKIYADEPDKPYYIPHMEISPALYQKLDWQAKLDRDSENIDALMEDGRKSARRFLKARKLVVERRQDPGESRAQIRALHAELIRS